MTQEIENAIKLLTQNGYGVVKLTPYMEAESDLCDRLDAKGESKDCCDCGCSICLTQHLINI